MVVAAPLLAALLFAACREENPEPPQPVRAVAGAPRPPVIVTVAAFSTMGEVFRTKILPGAKALHRARREGDLRFVELYQASGLLRHAIMSGFAADVGVFSHAEDVDRLVEAGFVQPAWRSAPYGSILGRTLVVLAVRKDDPKGIRDWSDLARPGVEVVTPDPRTSGGGMWNACAIYGAALRGHAGVPAGDHGAALAFLARVLANVKDFHHSAHDSFRAFCDGRGDVAITYESEVVQGWNFGERVQRVVPRSTLVVESPAVLLTKNDADPAVRAAAVELLQYLWSEETQGRLAFHGLRPVVPEVAARTASQFPEPEDAWTIGALGGWERAVREILAPAGLSRAEPAPGK